MLCKFSGSVLYILRDLFQVLNIRIGIKEIFFLDLIYVHATFFHI